jgi:uncharacterized protein with LGFP repeats
LISAFVAAAAFLILWHAPEGNGAEMPSPWLDADKPVASVLFTQESVLERMATDLGLTSSQISLVKETALAEAQSLAELKHESDEVVKSEDLPTAEKQMRIEGMGYNDRVRRIVTDSRTKIESLMNQEQLAMLVDLTADMMQGQRDMAVQAALSLDSPTTAGAGPYQIYATQYFSNFGSASVEVAVPDKYVKFASLGWEYHSGYPQGGNYSVNLGYNGHRLDGVRVKDVGPWNIDDNYWNSGGSRPRRLFQSLSTGLPESQAAYYNDFNGGLDQFGRVVTNPAGIDLSPQAGVQLGLGYLVSGWVTVSFNWEGASTPPPPPPPPSYPIVGAIKARYDALGGAPGAAHNAEYSVTGGRAQDFDHGRLIWEASSGTVSWVYGGTLSKYDSLGATRSYLGMPMGDETATPGGRLHQYRGGQIYWSPATSAHTLVGGIMHKFGQLGGTPRLGFPVADEEASPGGRVSRFFKGYIFWSPSTGSQMVNGAILTKLLALGGTMRIGYPTSDEYDVPGGRASNFQVGRIYWSPSTGTHHVLGAILNEYDARGGPNALGLPTTDELAAGGAGYRMSDFSRGRIYWSPAFGIVPVYGAIYAKYVALGGHASMGLPLAEERDVPGKPGARMAQFERSQIYYSPDGQSWSVYGGIMGKYLEMGGPAALGLPRSDEYAVAGGRANNFEVGRIYWSPATGTHHVLGGIMAKYDALGGPINLGLPTSDEKDIPARDGARMNDFASGSVFWTASGGSHGVYGAIGAKYRSAGGVSILGLPLADETAAEGVAGARMGAFEGGRIYWSPTTGANIVNGGILASYLLIGGSQSELGLPVSDEFSVPGGRRSDFEHGYISWDYTTGQTEIVPQ